MLNAVDIKERTKNFKQKGKIVSVEDNEVLTRLKSVTFNEARKMIKRNKIIYPNLTYI